MSVLLNFVTHGDHDNVKIHLLDGDPDLTYVDRSGCDALIIAAGKNFPKCVKLLINSGKSNPGHVDNSGLTALICAASNDNVECMQLLIATGKSNPGHKDDRGNTALMHASTFSQYKAVKLLLATNESNPGHKDDRGITASALSPLCRKIILWKMAFDEIVRRRRIAFSIVRYWSRDAGSPSSNQTFFIMGQAFQDDCSFEELSTSIPGCSSQNHYFYKQGTYFKQITQHIK